MTLLRWHGDRILQRMDDASKKAIDETTAAAVSTAQGMRSGSSRASAGLENRPAQAKGSSIIGQWGIFDRSLWWELFIEVGNPYRGGDNAKRRAADAEHPMLARRIREHFGG